MKNHKHEAYGPHRSPEKHFLAPPPLKKTNQKTKTNQTKARLVEHAELQAGTDFFHSIMLHWKKPRSNDNSLAILNLSLLPILCLSHIRTCIPAMTELNL